MSDQCPLGRRREARPRNSWIRQGVTTGIRDKGIKSVEWIKRKEQRRKIELEEQKMCENIDTVYIKLKKFDIICRCFCCEVLYKSARKTHMPLTYVLDTFLLHILEVYQKREEVSQFHKLSWLHHLHICEKRILSVIFLQFVHFMEVSAAFLAIGKQLSRRNKFSFRS